MFLLVYGVLSYHEHVVSIFYSNTVIHPNVCEIWYGGEQMVQKTLRHNCCIVNC